MAEVEDNEERKTRKCACPRTCDAQHNRRSMESAMALVQMMKFLQSANPPIQAISSRRGFNAFVHDEATKCAV